ncbi:MAG: phosphoribosylamine--glycine ligase [Anaplasmataceae bacterium]|nr:phosphoribosylamine--glycine ligase [Anaplasmataceae bacterium]
MTNKKNDLLNILVIGSGGREHALVWKLKQSVKAGKIFVAPGNPGTALIGENVSLDIYDHQAVLECVRQKEVSLVVVGPDDVLAGGLVDFLEEAGVMVFGPTRRAAEVEWSKSFAKDLLKQLNVPTAKSEIFSDIDQAKEYVKNQQYPLVIKASGLAMGKGVVIASSFDEAVQILEEMLVEKVFGTAGDKIIVEEFLEGEEVSIHAFCDGETAVLFPASQDHKQVFDNDQGPNTGGMGTVAPVPFVSKDVLDRIQREVVMPIISELKRLNRPFRGVLYPGIMMTKQGPKVLEFNARFGDPETQSYMRILKTDLVEIILSCTEGRLNEVDVEWEEKSACCIVLASKGYPRDYEKGLPISGINEVEKMEDVVVFHAGTGLVDDHLVTNGGRVFGVTAIGVNLDEALSKAYAAVKIIEFEGKHFRKDIG